MQLRPDRVLFWLDAPHQVARAAEQLVWLRATDPAFPRMVVAYRLAAEVELAMRAAGGLVYIPADGDIAALLEAWLSKWLRTGGACRPPPENAANVPQATWKRSASPAKRLDRPP